MATAKSSKKKPTKKKKAPVARVHLPAVPLVEIVALVTGVLGVFLTLALLSYHPRDPSANVVGDTGPVLNWVGPVGASLAEAVFGPVGYASIAFPVALLLLSYHLFQYRGLQASILRVMAGASLSGFVCLLLAIYPGPTSLRGGEVLAGGWVGDALVHELERHFNTPGTLLIVMAGLILSLQVAAALEIGPYLVKGVGFFNRSVVRAASATGSMVVAGAGAAASGASNLSQRVRQDNEESGGFWSRLRGRFDDDDDYEEANPLSEDEDEADEEEEVPPPPRRGRKQDAAPSLDESRARSRKARGDADNAHDEGTGEPLEAPRVRRLDQPRADAAQEGREVSPVSRREAQVSPRQEAMALNGGELPARSASARAAAAADEDLELDQDIDAFNLEREEASGDDALDDELAPPPTSGRGRKAVPSFGPKIVKSRYMEEAPVRLADEAFRQDVPENYELPRLEFLKAAPHQEGAMSEEELIASARVLEAKLRDYGVEGNVVEIHPGPVITMYEYAPAPGVKVAKITNLSNDLALALKATAVRIVAPLPGKAAVGIEVPNRSRQMVYLREVIEHEEFRRDGLKLPMAIGKDIEGKPYAGDMARMPHLLVAGSTGAGKSVAVNTMLLSLLYSRTPEEVRLILVDPKMIEFSVYNDIPHLLMPVVTDPRKAAAALNWGVDEMTRRYQKLTMVGARNIASYNAIMDEKLKAWDPAQESDDNPAPRRLPYIVIVIDELADLMMVAGKEVQDAIVRLAQMARAAGIHMIVATQRPSVDVITGLIKANFPSRIAFKVSSKTDSRTILDANGAEYLLGNGDMLFLPPGTASLVRLHGAFVSDDEARVVVEHLRKQGKPRYEESLLATVAEDGNGDDDEEAEEYDEKYEEAKEIVLETGMASISTIQRRLKIGYNRSARMVERMAKEGLIGPPVPGGKPREIFANKLMAAIRR